MVEPLYERRSARALLLNERDEVFLFKFRFCMHGGEWVRWILPGGKVEDGESFEEGLRRELFEELGLSGFEIGDWLWQRSNLLTSSHKGRPFPAYERFYLVRVHNPALSYAHMSEVEAKYTLDGRWWTTNEIAASRESFFCEALAQRVERALAGERADPPDFI